MNRQDRRLSKKEVKKNTQIINKLTPDQAKLLNLIVDQRTNDNIENFKSLIDRNMTAALINYDVKYEDIEGIQRDISSLFEEDSRKSEQLEKERLDLAKIDLEVREAVREVLKNFTVKKLAIEELTYKFSKLSKSMLINAYGIVELEFKNEVYAEIENFKETSNAEKTIKIIMDKFGLINDNASKYYYSWKKDYLVPKSEIEEKAANKKIKEDSLKPIDKAKEIEKIEPITVVKQTSIINKVEAIEMKNLLVLEEKVVKTIKVAGENGTYVGETDKGVVLSREEMSISFKNEKELDEWVSEFKQVLKMVM